MAGRPADGGFPCENCSAWDRIKGTLWNVRLYIVFKWQRIGFSAKGRGGYMLINLTYSTNGRKFHKKWLTNYQVIKRS